MTASTSSSRIIRCCLAIEFDFLTRILTEQDHIARFDIERNARAAVFFDSAAAGGDHRASLRLLFRGVRDDDPAAVLLTLFVATNDDSMVDEITSMKSPPHRLTERFPSAWRSVAERADGGTPRTSPSRIPRESEVPADADATARDAWSHDGLRTCAACKSVTGWLALVCAALHTVSDRHAVARANALSSCADLGPRPLPHVCIGLARAGSADRKRTRDDWRTRR